MPRGAGPRGSGAEGPRAAGLLAEGRRGPGVPAAAAPGPGSAGSAGRERHPAAPGGTGTGDRDSAAGCDTGPAGGTGETTQQRCRDNTAGGGRKPKGWVGCKEGIRVFTVRYRHRWPGEVMDVPSLETFMVRVGWGSEQAEDAPYNFRGFGIR